MEKRIYIAVKVLSQLLGIDWGDITVHVRDGKPTGFIEIRKTVKFNTEGLEEEISK